LKHLHCCLTFNHQLSEGLKEWKSLTDLTPVPASLFHFIPFQHEMKYFPPQTKLKRIEDHFNNSAKTSNVEVLKQQQI
jgi:hypothetical protein